MRTVRVPRTFYSDHEDRDLPTPRELGGGARYVIIDVRDPALVDLLADARYYADADGPDLADRSLRRSAAATVKALATKEGL